MTIDYHDRRFRSIANSATGDVGAGTVFHYRQHARVVWATYEGGAGQGQSQVEEIQE